MGSPDTATKMKHRDRVSFLLAILFTPQASEVTCEALRYYEGSILYEPTGFFSLPNFSSSIMVLGSTQPLTEKTSRNLPEE
jgi:hypothetical protein